MFMTNIENNFIDYIKSSNLRRNLFTTILAFLALFLIAKTVLTYKEAVDYKNINNISFITVTGKAEEYLIPDTLAFNITINEEGKNNAEATQKVANKEKKAIEILKSNGVKEEDIKLQGYNTQDKYENVSTSCEYGKVMPMIATTNTVKAIAPCSTTSSKIVGQIITQTIEVKIRDISKNADNDKRQKIMSELSAQNIKADNFAFTVYDLDSVKKELRAEAIKNAKLDAKKLSKDLGVKLDELTSFSDNNNYPMYGMGGDMATMKSVRAEMAPVSAPELTPGQEKVTVNVSLTYSIK